MFWSAVGLLIRLRWKLTIRAYARDASALVGVALALLIGIPASLAAGAWCGAHGRSRGALEFALFGVQILWLLLLLSGSGLSLSRSPSPSVLRPFPLRRGQIVCAAALGALPDLPLLLALPVFVALVCVAAQTRFGGLIAASTLILFAFQTTVMAQLIEQTAAWLAPRRRVTTGLALAAILCLGLSVPAAVASVTTAATATRAHARSAPPTVSAFLPSSLAARALERPGSAASLAALLGMAIVTALLLALADTLLRAVDRTQPEAAGGRFGGRVLPTVSHPMLAQVVVVAAVEWRNLLRNPRAHLPLRGPAMLLMAGFVAWIAPDLGGDWGRNLTDLAAMGSLIYAALWQVQLFTNRFGNEAGTATLLLGFPIDRRRLILGRSVALLGLAGIVDTALIVTLCGSAHFGRWIPPVLGGALLVLLTVYAIGNSVSVLSPFPIARRGEAFQAEPERALAFLYALIGGVAGGIVWLATRFPVAALLPPILFAATLLWSARALERDERRVTRRLDRGDGERR